MSTNDSLRVASLWHSMHGIFQQFSPVNGCTGIELLKADIFFFIYIASSLSQVISIAICKISSQYHHRSYPSPRASLIRFRLQGTKFFVVCEPRTPHMENLIRYIYELYTDYILKNPFYEIEMPIRCELFNINLTQVVQPDHIALLGR